jgi:hypothetical protein
MPQQCRLAAVGACISHFQRTLCDQILHRRAEMKGLAEQANAAGFPNQVVNHSSSLFALASAESRCAC